MQLRQRDLHILLKVFDRFPEVQQVRLFGSRATDTARRTSDIDLAVLAPRMTADLWAEFRECVEETPIIYKIDVVRLDTLPEGGLKNRILQEGVVIYPRGS